MAIISYDFNPYLSVGYKFSTGYRVPTHKSDSSSTSVSLRLLRTIEPQAPSSYRSTMSGISAQLIPSTLRTI